MIKVHRIKVGFIDRFSRAFIGIALVALSFAYAVNSETFATMNFIALYPIFTALVAWDPVYVAIEIIKQHWLDYSILHR